MPSRGPGGPRQEQEGSQGTPRSQTARFPPILSSCAERGPCAGEKGAVTPAGSLAWGGVGGGQDSRTGQQCQGGLPSPRQPPDSQLCICPEGEMATIPKSESPGHAPTMPWELWPASESGPQDLGPGLSSMSELSSRLPTPPSPLRPEGAASLGENRGSPCAVGTVQAARVPRSPLCSWLGTGDGVTQAQ